MSDPGQVTDSFTCSPQKKRIQMNTAEKKRKQNQSIIERQMILMGFLVHNCGYTILLSKPQKRASVGCQYFPIEKIFDDYGNEIYNKKATFTANCRSNEKSKRYAIELMRELLEQYNFEFEKKTTNRCKTTVSGKNVTLTNLLSVRRGTEYFEMTYLEKVMGGCIYSTLDAFASQVQTHYLLFCPIYELVDINFQPIFKYITDQISQDSSFSFETVYIEWPSDGSLIANKYLQPANYTIGSSRCSSSTKEESSN